MKTLSKIILSVLVVTMGFAPLTTAGQTHEAMQLALNIKKLDQLRKILRNMYDSYKIITDGYNRVQGVVNGNYKIHQVFLDGLYQVNPSIRNYKRVSDIIIYQGQIIKEYKRAYNRFKETGVFGHPEIIYMGEVYGNLLDQSLKNLDELSLILMSGTLRMSDDERLSAIDRIHQEMLDKLAFLRAFNNKTSILAMQRQRQKQDIKRMQRLYDIKP
jgi:hypothetical protein